MTANIQNLKKITLLLGIGTAKEKSDPIGAPVEFEFIYGMASAGLSPFECALYEKSPGEHLRFDIAAAEAPEFFGHLLLPVRQVLGLSIMPQKLALQVAVHSVDDPDNREIVQYLAKAGSGCGGSCGCGC